MKNINWAFPSNIPISGNSGSWNPCFLKLPALRNTAQLDHHTCARMRKIDRNNIYLVWHKIRQLLMLLWKHMLRMLTDINCKETTALHVLLCCCYVIFFLWNIWYMHSLLFFIPVLDNFLSRNLYCPYNIIQPSLKWDKSGHCCWMTGNCHMTWFKYDKD